MNSPVTKLLNKELCTGCEACANVCPVNAISMKPDELGFFYPYVDEQKCINCGKCSITCPALNKTNSSKNLKTICGYALNEDIVVASSSGGFFSLIAKPFIKQQGVVVGVVWNDDFKSTKHFIADNEEDFTKLVGSKYFQSRKGNIYNDVLNLLKEGKKVLFSGCPCEGAALSSVVPEKYKDNLYVIDLVCQGPSSDKALSQYIDYLEKKYKSNVTSLNMRVPIGCWIPQHFRVNFANGKSYLNRLYDTSFGDAVRIMQRPSCYSCSFCGSGRKSDLTLGDYHGSKVTDTFYHESGISIAVPHTKKGEYLLSLLYESGIYHEDCAYDEVMKHNPRIERSWKPLPEHDDYVEIFKKDGLFKASKKTLSFKRRIFRKIPLKTRIKIEKKFKGV